MKVDKRNPVHWWRLAAFLVCVLAAIILRPFRRPRARKRVVFYGHRLAGNLLPLYQRLRGRHSAEIEVAFLTMDPHYWRELSASGTNAIVAASREAVDWLSTSDAIVTDHGLHAMRPLQLATRTRFYDVWHGIPFKGFDGNDFRAQHRYDGAWVASPLMKRMYEMRYGFSPSRVHATGYPRTDQLVAGNPREVEGLRREFGLPAAGPIVLFAPTWEQDETGRGPYPFGESADGFVAMLSRVACRHGATVVIRQHLNSTAGTPSSLPGILHRPFASWPQTERLLRVTDVLVCDWSSIAFDFLLTGRATIFLDVKPPFRKGLSLDGSYRFGAIVGSMRGLESRLEAFLADPRAYTAEFGAAAAAIRQRVYGGCADGEATSRCVDQLIAGLRGSA